MPSRCDLHVHSRFSDRPSEWYLDGIGAPESFTEPLEVYRLCRERGMDFVTISDHNEIRGALEIAHLPGVFISDEVTASFPEDGAEVHCLVFGIDERQFEEIERQRGNIYALRDYLCAAGILHSVAHPLFRVNDQLTLAQLEKLLVLFNRFEGINGTRDGRGTALLTAICEGLTPQLLYELADRHGLAPEGPAPWRKTLTGGSDDHSGIYVATTWTETPPALDVAELLAHLARGEHRPGGELGSSLKLARSFQALAWDYYRVKVLAGSRFRRDPLAEMLRRLAAGEVEPQRSLVSLWISSVRRTLAGASGRDGGPGRHHGAAGRRAAVVAREEERRVFESSSRAAQRVIAEVVTTIARKLPRGPWSDLLPALTSLAPAALAVSPYLAAFRFQHKDEDLSRAAALRFAGAEHLADQGPRRGWATDTLADVNGVATTIRAVARLARDQDRPLTVLTSTMAPLSCDFDCENFAPVAELPVPQYRGLVVALPPFLEIIEHCERQRLSELVISTPGPVGLTALAAAKLLGLRTTGIYHTDFPRYLAVLAGGPRLGELAKGYLRWFYGQMDRVLAPSRAYLEELATLGIERRRLALLPRGVDCELFHPRRRDLGFYPRRGRPAGPPRLLYVGRISKEKNLDVLIQAYLALAAGSCNAELTLVGDGPYLAELSGRYARPQIEFTGLLAGEELATAYASADVFVLPSETDTLGNAVLEAQASGLPAVVCGRGPRDLVEDGKTGLVGERGDVASLVPALRALLANPELRRRLGEQARAAAVCHRWEATLDCLFATGEAPTARENGEWMEWARRAEGFGAAALAS